MFITTLPILFAFTHLISPLEIIIFFLAIFITVYMINPAIQVRPAAMPEGGLYDFLYAAWMGEVPLRWAFWPFFILVNCAFLYIDYRIDTDTYTVNSWKTMHLIFFLPTVWWVLSVWRSSAKCSTKFWSSAARAVTIYLMFDFIIRVVLSFKYPTTLFSCRLLLIEYGDCL